MKENLFFHILLVEGFFYEQTNFKPIHSPFRDLSCSIFRNIKLFTLHFWYFQSTLRMVSLSCLKSQIFPKLKIWKSLLSDPLHVVLGGVKRQKDRWTTEQGVYFVKTVHFFAASFCSFFTSCLMILFLCREKKKSSVQTSAIRLVPAEDINSWRAGCNN